MQTLGRDLRYALRSWRRAPGPIAAAVGALALGIAANTTIFSIVSGVLLRPLPYDHPERLVMVWQDMRASGGPAREWTSPGIYSEWLARSTVFEQLGAIRGWQPNLTGVTDPERLRGAAVSHGYFASLGVDAALGRTFSEDDDKPGGPAVAVVSHDLWVRRLGSDPGIIGRSLSLDGQSTVLIGVMPATFRAPILNAAEIWSPARIPASGAPRGMIVLRVIARLKPGVTLTQAQAELATVAQRIAADDPEWRGVRIALVPLHEDIVGDVRPVLLVLTGAVALVLLIACLNVMSLLLARTSERSREITIRTALGASRGRIVRQLLSESLLLASAGGTLGLALAWWGLHALLVIAPPSAPRLQDVRLDGVALAFALVVTLASAVVSGLAPAVAASRADLAPTLRDGGRESTSRGRLSSALVVLEVTLAMVLVVGAGLFVRTLVALQRVDLGFSSDHLMTASISPPRGTYPSEAATRQLYSRILERASAPPGVNAVAITSVLPLSGMDTDMTFQIEGRAPAQSPADQPNAWFRVVSPRYFDAMGMRMREGRGLSPEDRTAMPAVIVLNETLARRYWEGASPLGKRVTVEDQQATVVGVVADSHHRGPLTPPEAEMYLSYLQFRARSVFLVIRTSGPSPMVVPALRDAVRQIDPNLPLSAVAPMTQLAAGSVAQPRFLAALLTAFSFMAACLALVGIYSVLSFSVIRRTREIGIRMALGAGRRAVLGRILSGSMAVVGCGIAAGAVLAVLLSRLLGSLLFGVQPGDPLTIGIVGLLIAAAALGASYGPARRASLVDPLTALRED